MTKNFSNSTKCNEQSFCEKNYDKIIFISLTLATAMLLKQKGFSCALRLYPSGGAGFNIYKYCSKKDKLLRRFALDYHPFWEAKSKTKEYKLHYHRGESFNQIKKHRPYQGGW